MKVIPILIPARLNSERLPRKLLLEIGGIPMIERVRKICVEAVGAKNVFVVSGDDEIIQLIQAFNGQTVKTYEYHENGTSRVREASKKLGLENVMIVQGDEPFTCTKHILKFQKQMIEDQTSEIFCGVSKIKNAEVINNVDVVKCILNINNKIIYIFRNLHLKSVNFNKIKKIHGMIGFRNGSIKIPLQNEGTIGRSESIEQLILLENGLLLKSVEIDDVAPSVNTEEEFIQILDYYEKKYLTHNPH